MSQPTNEKMEMEEEISVKEDENGGVNLTVQKPMDFAFFASKLEESILHWKQQGNKEIRLNLPIQHSNLVDSAVKAGFKYYDAEPDYLMLVYQISGTTVNKKEVRNSEDERILKDLEVNINKLLLSSLGLCMIPFAYDTRTSEFKTFIMSSLSFFIFSTLFSIMFKKILIRYPNQISHSTLGKIMSLICHSLFLFGWISYACLMFIYVNRLNKFDFFSIVTKTSFYVIGLVVGGYLPL